MEPGPNTGGIMKRNLLELADMSSERKITLSPLRSYWDYTDPCLSPMVA